MSNLTHSLFACEVKIRADPQTRASPLKPIAACKSLKNSAEAGVEHQARASKTASDVANKGTYEACLVVETGTILDRLGLSVASA